MKIKEIIRIIEDYAPIQYQESYDNCGMQVGEPDNEVSGVLLTLDVTEEIVAEAIARNCNLIIAHHPLIFSGLKKITGRNYVERTVLKAIRSGISIYAAHTNLDNVHNGVNAIIAARLGLINTSILTPKYNTLSKLFTYAPTNVAGKVRDAMFAAGAGTTGNYKECSFNTSGNGTFKPEANANPAIGEAGGNREWVDEVKIEVLVAKHNEQDVISALKNTHPYEEVAWELIPINNANQEIGSGMIGELPEPICEALFLKMIKEKMNVPCIRHTELTGKMVKKVALCGGSGSFLLNDAIRQGAHFFITGDFKYHQFFDAEGKIVIADIGHYESEQFTPEIFEAVLRKKLPNFAVLLSNVLTNPVKYFF